MSKLEWQLLAIYLFVILALTVIGLALSDDSRKKQEVLITQTTVDASQDSRIEQLEKEIRILKTDIYILQYGHEGE